MLKKGIRLAVFLAVQFCIVQTCVKAQEISASELLLTFTSGHEYGSSSLTFNADGTYKIEAGDCTTEYFNSGKYNFLANVINFNELTFKSQRRGFDESYIDQLPEELRAEARKENIREENFAENSKIYKMMFVKWSDRLYLMSEDNLGNFCDAINLGIEPRLELTSDPFYGSFYLREGDEFKSVSGTPNLPENWNGFLLKKTITAKIIKIENGEKEEKIITVNQGSLSGLKVGMRLIKKNQEPSLWSDAKVTSIEKNTAKLSSYRTNENLKVGEFLTSKFVRSKEEEMFIRIRREEAMKNRPNQ